MNEDQRIEHLVAAEILRGATAPEAAVVSSVMRHMALSLLDAMTIRDLMALGGYPGDRALAVGLSAMFAGLAEGSLCMDLDANPFFDRLPDGEGKPAGTLFGEFAAGLVAGRYGRLVAAGGGRYMPLVLDASTGRRLLYFHRYHVHENRLKERMELFLNAQGLPAPAEGEIDGWVDAVYADPLAIRAGSDRVAIVRDPQQVDAIRMAVRSPFAIVSGGPGTGKTSLMVNILRCLVRAGVPVSRMVLGAPTGRAAQRMTEAIQTHVASIREPDPLDGRLLELAGGTLHKILGYRGRTHDFLYRCDHPLPASVVVVDEVSMVDVVMMDTFLQAIHPGQTRLILLGDKNQLPSVDAGAVFAEMIPDGTRAARFRDRYVVLETVYRSGNRLLELARKANRGTFPPASPVSFGQALALGPDRWAFVRAGDADRWQAHLARWASVHYAGAPVGGRTGYRELVERAGEMDAEGLLMDKAGQDLLDAIFSHVERARILTLLRRGLFGCAVINDAIAGFLARSTDPGADLRIPVFAGAVIIVNRNDYEKGLFNGDVGVILRDASGTYRAFFHRSGGAVGFPVDLLPSWELGFAMTVHKSQGSEFDDVLLVLPDDEDHRLLTREIIYTGITRARKRVLIYGTRPVLEKALARKIRRQSGLTWDTGVIA